jgi:hypothetical protein
LFQTTWGPSLDALVGREPADLEGELAPLEAESYAGALAQKRALVDELARWLWSRNQFLVFREQELQASIERALEAMERTGQARPALRAHRKELAAFVRAKLGDEPREVTCAEYSPELQLQVLGLAHVRGPVLDVGCGPKASLVHHLRAHGIEAEGFDRALDGSDWLTHDYGLSRYRTVVSHQGFSLHFLHHHHQPGDTAYDYARAFMAILRALAPGGVFAYAPGLPFLEAMLKGYRVERVPFDAALRVPALVEVEQRTGLSFSYATHITH